METERKYPIKNCDYCDHVGMAYTTMTGETICKSCLSDLPTDPADCRRLIVKQRKQLAELQETLQRSHVDFESALSLAEKCSSLPKPEAKAAFDKFVSETTYESTTEAFANKHHDIGVNACIDELTQCYEVALRENGDIDDANSIEVLIDHLQQLRKQQD